MAEFQLGGSQEQVSLTGLPEPLLLTWYIWPCPSCRYYPVSPHPCLGPDCRLKEPEELSLAQVCSLGQPSSKDKQAHPEEKGTALPRPVPPGADLNQGFEYLFVWEETWDG